MKPSHIIAAIIALVLGVVWVIVFWFNGVFQTHKNNEPHRAALLQIHDELDLGASHSEVLAAYWLHRTDSMRLLADQPSRWVIRMPLEFGARDWNLLLEFHDDRVTAVRVRTSDGPPPKDGPGDKQLDR